MDGLFPPLVFLVNTLSAVCTHRPCSSQSKKSRDREHPPLTYPPSWTPLGLLSRSSALRSLHPVSPGELWEQSWKVLYMQRRPPALLVREKTERCWTRDKAFLKQQSRKGQLSGLLCSRWWETKPSKTPSHRWMGNLVLPWGYSHSA